MKNLIDKMKVDLYWAVGNVNSYAERQDIGRNHTNYGVAETCAKVLNTLGCNTEIACWADGDYLKVAKVVIDGKTTEF